MDMVSRLDFPEADAVAPAAASAADAIARLRKQADKAGVPVIYVNDNGDRWHSERSRLVEDAAASDSGGRCLLERIAPRHDDYFVIKPCFSGFYATNLPVLLPRLGVNRLVLTGMAADICVLFTAADAHMRDYALWVPADAVASAASERTGWALDIMEQAMGAETAETGDMTLADWVAAS